MEDGFYALNVGLRVLTAITENCDPEPSDVDAIHSLEPFAVDQSLEELAHDVIGKAFKAMRESRGSLALRHSGRAR